jgi:O-antigen ligase
MLVMAAASGAQDTVSEELSDLERSDFIRYKLSKRVFLVDKALEIWADHPWFGVGGWGYRYLLGVYLEPDQWDLIERGRANVHNDPAQFLAEFGLFGASMLLAAILALAWPMVRGHVWKHPIATMPLIGLVAILLYSLIDLPFRSPAILYTWSVIAAAIPRLVAPGDVRG